MSTNTIDIEGVSVEECRELVRSRIPKGFRIQFETTVRDGKPEDYVAVADTSEEALKRAREKVPKKAEVVKEQVLREPKRSKKYVQADSEGAAWSLITKEMGLGWDARIDRIELAQQGKKGFLGIGKKQSAWSATLFHPAKAAVSARQRAFVRFSLEVRKKLYFQAPDGATSGKAQQKEPSSENRMQECPMCGRTVAMDRMLTVDVVHLSPSRARSSRHQGERVCVRCHALILGRELGFY